MLTSLAVATDGSLRGGSTLFNLSSELIQTRPEHLCAAAPRIRAR